MSEEKTAYINFTARAKTTTADGILTEAHRIEDTSRKKTQQKINDELYDKVGSSYKYMGSKRSFSEVTALTGVKKGDVWNIETEFEVSNLKYSAGTNVVATQDSSSASSTIWDPLGGSMVDIKPLEDRTDLINSQTAPRFDGIIMDQVTVKENTAIDITKIVYLEKNKTFVAVKNSGALGADEYYSSWRDSVRDVSLYKEGINPIKNKVYIYDKDVYVFNNSGSLVKCISGLATKDEMRDLITDDVKQTSLTTKALSARATNELALSHALARQSTEIVGIARVERGVKVEMASYSGLMKVPPSSLVLVIDPSEDGLAGNHLCAFLDGKYFPTSGMNEESLRIKKEKTFVRTPDGSIYTQDTSGNPCIFDASSSGPEVVQTTGQSTTSVMSQKAVTDAINKFHWIKISQTEYDHLVTKDPDTLYIIIG